MITFRKSRTNLPSLVAGITFTPTNTLDIGTSTAAGAPRNIFAGTKVVAPSFTTTGTATNAFTLASTEAIGVAAGGFTQYRLATAQFQAGISGTDAAHTSGSSSMLAVGNAAGTVSFAPASGTGSFAFLHINPVINGVSSGTAYGLGVASKTNTLTGGTIRLASFGTTTTDLFTGYTERAYIDTAGVVWVQMGTSTGFAGLCGVANVNTTSTASSQTAKQTLLSYTLPANAFSANAKGVRITAWGTAKATANNKTQTIDFGATSVASTGAVANNAGVWRLVAEVYRTGSGAQASSGWAQSATTVAVTNSTPAETDTGTIAITVTSTNVTDVDGTTAKGLLVEFLN